MDGTADPVAHCHSAILCRRFDGDLERAVNFVLDSGSPAAGQPAPDPPVSQVRGPERQDDGGVHAPAPSAAPPALSEASGPRTPAQATDAGLTNAFHALEVQGPRPAGAAGDQCGTEDGAHGVHGAKPSAAMAPTLWDPPRPAWSSGAVSGSDSISGAGSRDEVERLRAVLTAALVSERGRCGCKVFVPDCRCPVALVPTDAGLTDSGLCWR